MNHEGARLHFAAFFVLTEAQYGADARMPWFRPQLDEAAALFESGARRAGRPTGGRVQRNPNDILADKRSLDWHPAELREDRQP